MTIENVNVIGTLDIVLYDQNGEVKDSRNLKNIIVAGGLAHIVSRMVGVAQASMGWLAVGTGTVAPVVANTLLGAEVARGASTVTIVTTTQANDTVQHITTFGPGVGTGALTEAGLFNIATANTGLMLNRLVFAVINKGASDTITLTWKIKIA